MHAWGGAAACDTEKALPAMVAEPLRALVAVLGATVNVTDPEPVRPVPLLNVRKPLPLVASHAHPVCVVTSIVPVPPASDTLALAGLIE